MTTISSRPTAVENFLNAAGDTVLGTLRYAAYYPASKSVDAAVAKNAKEQLKKADDQFVRGEREAAAGVKKTGAAIEAGVKAVDTVLTDAGKAIAAGAKAVRDEFEAANKRPSPQWVKDFHNNAGIGG